MRHGPRARAAALTIMLALASACESPDATRDAREAETDEVAATSQALVGASTDVALAVPDALRQAPFDAPRTLRVPAGFRAALHARVPGARFMTIDPDGQLLVSVPSRGTVLRVDASGRVSELLRGLARPHDLVFHTMDGATYLYVSEKNQVRRYVYVRGAVSGAQTIVAGLPDASLSELRGAYGHELKNIAIGPGDRLYVSIASATNADPRDLDAEPKRGAIYAYPARGGAGTLLAQGIRNAEGLAIEPTTGALWVVVNNRDNIAYPFHRDWDGDGRDDYGRVMQSYVDGHPPEAFIRVRAGGNYGWPFCNPNPDQGLIDMPYDRDVQNNADGARLDCSRIDRVNRGIEAHAAPLGLSFLPTTGAALPAGYAGAAVSAYHGCWNCSRPAGYKVALFPFANGAPTEEIELATGFRAFGGRPVDVVASARGELFISDDALGAIYKLTYAPAPEPTGRVCTSVGENGVATLTCPAGTRVQRIAFASYGTPTGSCGAWVRATCDAPRSTRVVEGSCLGRASCSVLATNGTFGDPCPGVLKRLSIEASCAP